MNRADRAEADRAFADDVEAADPSARIVASPDMVRYLPGPTTGRDFPLTKHARFPWGERTIIVAELPAGTWTIE